MINRLFVAVVFAVGCGVVKPGGVAGTGGATNGTGGGGSSGGSVGAGGTDAGDAGTGGVGAGGGDVGRCGQHSFLGNRGRVWVMGPGAGTFSNMFEGAATVERSVEDDLTIYYEPPRIAMGARGGAGGASIASGYHARISGWAPVLPVGAKVWMTKTPDGNQVRDPRLYGQDPWHISLWDRQGGTLLLEAHRGIGLTRTMECAAMAPSCEPGLTTYYSVEVPGDAPLVLNDGETGVIVRDRKTYDVHVSSQRSSTIPSNCLDYHGEDTTCLDVKLKDATGLSFDMATPPACTEGNDPIRRFVAYIPNVRTFDGRVAFLETRTGSFYFDAGNGLEAGIATSPSIFAEPAVGQEFWLTIQGVIATLRTSQNGELLLASIAAGGDRDAIPKLLGMTVTVENDCAYTMDYFAVSYLRRVAFGSTPPVTVRSGSRGTVSIGGRDYHAAYTDGNVVIWK